MPASTATSRLHAIEAECPAGLRPAFKRRLRHRPTPAQRTAPFVSLCENIFYSYFAPLRLCVRHFPFLVPFSFPPRYARPHRSEEHTSELQSLMRISYAVFCLKKKT